MVSAIPFKILWNMGALEAGKKMNKLPLKKRIPLWPPLFYFSFLPAGILLFIFWEQLRSAEFILLLQGYRSPAADFFFRAFTFLGDDLFFLLFFCIMFWCFDRGTAFSAGALLLFSGVCSNLIKEFTALPRPIIEGVTPPSGYSFPSGHALTAVALWGYLAVKIKKAWFWGWAITAIALISFSRLFLGFHFAGDVLGGLLIGLVLLAVFLWVERLLPARIIGLNLGKSASGGLARTLLPFVFLLAAFFSIFIFPGRGLPRILGLLAGGYLGYILGEGKILSPPPKGLLHRRLINIFIGLSGLFVLFYLCGEFWNRPCRFFSPLSFLSYVLTGLWITFLAPLIFNRLSRGDSRQ